MNFCKKWIININANYVAINGNVCLIVTHSNLAIFNDNFEDEIFFAFRRDEILCGQRDRRRQRYRDWCVMPAIVPLVPRLRSAAAAAVAANIEIDDAISGHEVQPHVPGSSRPITHAMHWRGTAVNSIAFTHNYRRISNFDSRVSVLAIAPCALKCLTRDFAERFAPSFYPIRRCIADATHLGPMRTLIDRPRINSVPFWMRHELAL